MRLYDLFFNSFKGIKNELSNDPTTADNISGALAAELTIIVCFLLSALLLRHFNVFASIIVIIFLLILLLTNIPLAPKIKSEQGDSLNKMMFYAIVCLGVLVAVIYWGVKYV